MAFCLRRRGRAVVPHADEGQQKADQVRLTSFTIEGDPILEELVYDNGGNEKGRKVTSCAGIEEQKEADGTTVYRLTDCDQEFGQYVRWKLGQEHGPE